MKYSKKNNTKYFNLIILQRNKETNKKKTNKKTKQNEKIVNPYFKTKKSQ